MKGFACYRLPNATGCWFVDGEVCELSSVSELNGRTGFVMAPFVVTQHHKVLLIEGIPELADANKGLDTVSLTDCQPLFVDSYPFEKFYRALLHGKIQKLVLARQLLVYRQKGQTTVSELFRRACESYPHMFVSLVYTSQSGLWLLATPELLLQGRGENWMTIALAGTMRQNQEGESWSEKNCREQRLVADYIGDCLRYYAGKYVAHGPYTVHAAHLLHLRTDFTFRLADNKHLGDLLYLLHPTPAVCGLPKVEALHFILDNEPMERGYYSGFMGMLQPDGDTRLYVSLRCMQIFKNACCLYAGSGLLPESTVQQEWEETEVKMETMRHLLE